MTNDVLIPLRSGSKRPIQAATKWQAPSPPVDEWAELAEPDGNWGLRLDGYLVIDCDTVEARLWWETLCGNDHHTPVQVSTPHGHHYYYRLPEGAEVKAGPLKNPDGTPMRVDVKTGPGHYVVVPPSSTEDGPYEWVGSKRPADAPVAALGLLGALQDVRDAYDSSRASAAPGEGVDLVPSGTRHDTLVAMTGLMRRLGWSDSLVGRVLNGLNNSVMEDGPVPTDELLGIIQSTAQWVEPEIVLVSEPDDPGEKPPILLASKMKKQPPRPWLWHPYWVEGRLILLDGYEGIGKGMLSAYSAVRCASGDWGEPSPVLWLSIEDDPEEDIFNRLLAVGYDSSRHADIHFINPDVAVGFPTDIPAIERYIIDNGIRLVIVDPGRSYLRAEGNEPMNYNNDAQVGTGMRAINRMAARTGTSIVFIHHWNKNTEGSTRHRAGGSAAFTQAVRHRVTVAKVGTDDHAEWAMAVTKTNYGTEGHLRSYRLEAVAEHDTAAFVLGDPIKSHLSIGEWEKSRQKELDAAASMPLDDYSTVELYLDSHVPAGQLLPSRDDVAAGCGISKHRAEVVLAQLSDEGRIVKAEGNRRRWQG